MLFAELDAAPNQEEVELESTLSNLKGRWKAEGKPAFYQSWSAVVVHGAPPCDRLDC